MIRENLDVILVRGQAQMRRAPQRRRKSGGRRGYRYQRQVTKNSFRAMATKKHKRRKKGITGNERIFFAPFVLFVARFVSSSAIRFRSARPDFANSTRAADKRFVAGGDFEPPRHAIEEAGRRPARFSRPSTDSCGPVMPTSHMKAVCFRNSDASAVATCVCVPSTAVDAAVEMPAQCLLFRGGPRRGSRPARAVELSPQVFFNTASAHRNGHSAFRPHEATAEHGEDEQAKAVLLEDEMIAPRTNRRGGFAGRHTRSRRDDFVFQKPFWSQDVVAERDRVDAGREEGIGTGLP